MSDVKSYCTQEAAVIAALIRNQPTQEGLAEMIYMFEIRSWGDPSRVPGKEGCGGGGGGGGDGNSEPELISSKYCQ
jgi:hypothetical protein